MARRRRELDHRKAAARAAGGARHVADALLEPGDGRIGRLDDGHAGRGVVEGLDAVADLLRRVGAEADRDRVGGGARGQGVDASPGVVDVGGGGAQRPGEADRHGGVGDDGTADGRGRALDEEVEREAAGGADPGDDRRVIARGAGLALDLVAEALDVGDEVDAVALGRRDGGEIARHVDADHGDAGGAQGVGERGLAVAPALRGGEEGDDGTGGAVRQDDVVGRDHSPVEVGGHGGGGGGGEAGEKREGADRHGWGPGIGCAAPGYIAAGAPARPGLAALVGRPRPRAPYRAGSTCAALTAIDGGIDGGRDGAEGVGTSLRRLGFPTSR